MVEILLPPTKFNSIYLKALRLKITRRKTRRTYRLISERNLGEERIVS